MNTDNYPLPIYCSRCGNKRDASARFCSQCAAPIQALHLNLPASSPPAPTKNVGIMLGLGIFFMPHLFSWKTLKKGYSLRARVVSFGWMGFVILTTLLSVIFSSGVENTQSLSKSTLSESSLTSSTSVNTSDSQVAPKSEVKPSVALSNFRNKISSIPSSTQLFSRVELGMTPRVLNIYVKNNWFDAAKHQQRQLTTQLASLWEAELGTSVAILHIYDQTGHEVAGKKVWGGVWVEDE